jgi:hypothetical protein
MKLIALDPSGNFKEGKGTTGICILEDGNVTRLDDVKASNFSSALEYWDYIIMVLYIEKPDILVFEGYKLYNHKGMSAKTQANSELETPQLIGVLKYWCYFNAVPFVVQYASDVKTRWSEDVLVRLGYLTEKKTGRGTSYYWNDQLTVTHHRDALKHALHYWRYKHEGK